jgi:hypothetical protein
MLYSRVKINKMAQETTHQDELRHADHFEMLFMGLAVAIKRGDAFVYADVRSHHDAIALGIGREEAEHLLSNRPGRSCHLIYSRWRWSGFKCDDDTCEGGKECVLHIWDKNAGDWKPSPSPGTNEDAIYACFCV